MIKSILLMSLLFSVSSLAETTTTTTITTCTADWSPASHIKPSHIKITMEHINVHTAPQPDKDSVKVTYDISGSYDFDSFSIAAKGESVFKLDENGAATNSKAFSYTANDNGSYEYFKGKTLKLVADITKKSNDRFPNSSLELEAVILPSGAGSVIIRLPNLSKMEGETVTLDDADGVALNCVKGDAKREHSRD